MNIDGNTELIAHIGYPTHSFKSPLIYNPYFEKQGINALVVPMGCQAEHYPAFLESVFKLTNIRGALITMPHKVSTVSLLDEATPTVKVAGACNAVKLDTQGRLVGDMFDGVGFVRGVLNKGLVLTGKRVLVVGTGGVGSAIAASLAAEKIASISLFDVNTASCEGLAQRLKNIYPQIQVDTGSNDPDGHDLVVNATRTKQLTNFRVSGKEDAIKITPPIDLTLEYGVEFIDDDELVEITPKSVRLRKRFLKEHERKRAGRA